MTQNPKAKDARDLLENGTFRRDRHAKLLDRLVLKAYDAAGPSITAKRRAALRAMDNTATLHRYEHAGQLFAVAHGWLLELRPFDAKPDEIDAVWTEVDRRWSVVRQWQGEYNAAAVALKLDQKPMIHEIFVDEDDYERLLATVTAA